MNEESISNPAPFQYMTVCTVSLALLLGLFLIFPLKERVTNAKQVQMMAGVNPVIFWISNFVWDFIVYMIIATILALILYLFDERKTLHSNFLRVNFFEQHVSPRLFDSFIRKNFQVS